MKRFLLLAMLATSFLGCRDFDECTADPQKSCPVAENFTCTDSCEKFFSVCGFTNFGGDMAACTASCLAEPIERRNLSCYREATCVAITEGVCTLDQYQGYEDAGGASCGQDSRGYNVRCEPGDLCLDESSNRCSRSETSGYQAYQSAGGPYCGEDGGGIDVSCVPGDTCINEFSNRCE